MLGPSGHPMNEKTLSIKEIEDLEAKYYPLEWHLDSKDKKIHIFASNGKRLQSDHIVYRAEIKFINEQIKRSVDEKEFTFEGTIECFG